MIAALLLVQAPIVPKDDLVINASCRIKPGTYRLDDRKGDGLIKLGKDGIRVDFTGVKLIGKGTVLSLSSRKRVHVVGLDAQGYEGGVKVNSCSDVTLENLAAPISIENSPKCDVLFAKTSSFVARKADGLFALGLESQKLVSISDSERIFLGYVKSQGVRLDTVTIGSLFRVECVSAPIGAELVNCTSIHTQYCDFLRGDVGLRIQGGEDNWLLNSNVRNQRIGIELVKTREAVIGANTIRDCSTYAVEASGAGDIFFESNEVKNAPIPASFAPLGEHSEEYHHREWLRNVVDRGKELWQKRLGN